MSSNATSPTPKTKTVEDSVMHSSTGGNLPPVRPSVCRLSSTKAKDEFEAFQYAAERAGETLDRIPRERKSDWLRQASRDFEPVRADYEEMIGQLAEAREQLAQEAELINFLVDGPASVRMGHTVHVHTSGVEGLVHEVAPADVLVALRDELATLELDALLGAHR